MCVKMSQQHMWLSELNNREALLEQEAKDYYWKECGHEGEVKFSQISQRESAASWEWVFDLRLQTKAGEIQLDAVLICEVGWICFEVKNYRAAYQFSDKKLTVNGIVQFHDVFKQVERSRSIFEQVARQFSALRELQYYVVFINEEDTVNIEEGVSDIPYLKNAKLLQFYRDLRFECERLANLPAVFNRDFRDEAMKLRAMHKIDNRRYSLSEERFINLKKGLYCERCREFNLEVTRYYIICKECGFCEGKEKATLRLICALGILLPYEGLNPYKAWQLSGGMLNVYSIIKVMNKHFIRNSTKHSYKNNNQSFKDQFSHNIFHYKDKDSPHKIR